MKRIFVFLGACVCALSLNAQNGEMVCNFDDVYPDVSAWGDMGFDVTNAPAGSLASDMMGVLTVNADNENGSMVIQLDFPFDPRDYVGISLVAQVTEPGVNPAFIFKLDQSSDPGNLNQIQDWTYNVRYSGSGEWEKINLPFSDAILGALDEKLADDLSFPTEYDKIELAPGAWDNKPAFTMNIDDIMLRYSWDEENGIPLIKAAAFVITAVNGTVSATSVNGNPVSLKVYSLSGQEVANGLNQVQIGTKGVYVVKAANGNASNVSKIVVR